LGGKAVDAVISLGFLANETAESVGGEGTSVTAGGVDITDVDLDWSVVLSSDQAVGGGAVGRSLSVKV
jgi:hypothetical protein